MASQTGRNDSGTDPFGPNRNELLVDLQPYDTWRAGRTKAGLVEELARRLTANIPGVAFNFTQPITLGVIFILLFVAFGTALDAGLIQTSRRQSGSSRSSGWR